MTRAYLHPGPSVHNIFISLLVNMEIKNVLVSGKTPLLICLDSTNVLVANLKPLC